MSMMFQFHLKGIRLFRYDQMYTLLDRSDNFTSSWLLDNSLVLSHIEGVLFYVVYHSHVRKNDKSYHNISMIFGVASFLGNNGYLLESLSSYLKDDPLENWLDDCAGLGGLNLKFSGRESQWDEVRSYVNFKDLMLDDYLFSQSKEWHDQLSEITSDPEIESWLSSWKGRAMYRNHYGDIPKDWILMEAQEVLCSNPVELVEVPSINSEHWDVKRIHHVYSVYLLKKKWKYVRSQGFYDDSGTWKGSSDYFYYNAKEVAIKLKEWYPVQLRCYPLELLANAIRCYNRLCYEEVFSRWESCSGID